MNETEIDWHAIPGDEWYDPASVVSAFALVRSGAPGATGAMLSAVAHDHSGVVYPAAYSAVPILLDIAATHSEAHSRSVALAVIDTLLWFQPAVPYDSIEIDGVRTPLDSAIRQLVRDSLPRLRANQLPPNKPNQKLINAVANSLAQREV